MLWPAVGLGGEAVRLLAGGWAGQHVVILPTAVVVTTGDPRFDPGPPPRDELPSDWRPALELVRRYLLPVLRAPAGETATTWTQR